MAINPHISATQSLAYNNLITLIDDSSGSDGSLTNRRVYIRTATNKWLTDGQVVSSTIAYTNWAYGDATIQLDVLMESTSPEITVEWYAGASLVTAFTDTFDFNLGDYVFQLGLLASQTSSGGRVLQDANYYSNMLQFIVNMANSEVAISVGDDIYSAQNALNINQNFISNENDFF